MGALSIITAVLNLPSTVFLILASLAAAIVSNLYLAQDGDIRFGVFGYRDISDNSVTKAALYAVSLASSADDYLFNDNRRDQVSKILVVYPAAAGLSFISFLVAAMNNGKARCKFLSVVSVIFSILAFLATALVCIITFLVFYPHISWLTWVQIASSLLNLIAVVMSLCNLSFHKSSSDDITSMDGDNNEYSLKDNLLDEKENNFHVNAFSVPPPRNFNNNIQSSDESSITERKSINDITINQNRYMSSNSAITDPSEQMTHLNQEPSIYKGPLGSSIRSEAPMIMPETAETQREPTIPQIDNPYHLQNSSFNNDLSIGDDRNIMKAGYNDDNVLDNNSLEADSDFTSVSRRAINPKYYRGAPNVPSQQFGPPPQQYMMPQNPYNPQQQQQQQQQQQYMMPQQQMGPHHQHAPFGRRIQKPNPSDIILQNNPNFMVGQGAARHQMTKYGKSLLLPQQMPRMGQNYKNRQLRNQLPPASMAKDSPYASFV